jgi:NAD(P)-dependent dehydrogenase (short-subunit alcohol dehydrogenase family)
MTTTGASIYTNPTALFGVEGQVAVVTGGGTGKVFYTLVVVKSYHLRFCLLFLGIGLMMATALESNGATVYIIGRRLEVIEKAAKENNVRNIVIMVVVLTPRLAEIRKHYPAAG